MSLLPRQKNVDEQKTRLTTQHGDVRCQLSDQAVLQQSCLLLLPRLKYVDELKMRLVTQRSSHLSRPVLNNKQECFRHKMTDRSELKSGSGINMPVMVEDEENTKKVTY